jgi:hypothetical protein
VSIWNRANLAWMPGVKETSVGRPDLRSVVMKSGGQGVEDKTAAIPSPACAENLCGANSFRPTGNWSVNRPAKLPHFILPSHGHFVGAAAPHWRNVTSLILSYPDGAGCQRTGAAQSFQPPGFTVTLIGKVGCGFAVRGGTKRSVQRISSRSGGDSVRSVPSLSACKITGPRPSVAASTLASP